MKITNLKESPQYYEQTIDLIEDSFNYDKKNSFKIDFYPLLCSENQEHAYIIVENNNVIAHIGILLKHLRIKEKNFPIMMLGGIAVDSNYRGQGLFSQLYSFVSKKYPEVCFEILWSDQIDLYKKFDFYPCLEQFEYQQKKLKRQNNYIKTKLNNLHSTEIKTLHELYLSNDEVRVHRALSDWEKLKKITSTDLYLKKENNKITNYFFKNKGEDLNNIIHEYGFLAKENINEILEYGTLWTPQRFDYPSSTLYAALIKIKSHTLFSEFILNTTNIKILKVEKNIKFRLHQENFLLPIEQFLTGILGPGKFKEIDSRKFFISGLDSI